MKITFLTSIILLLIFSCSKSNEDIFLVKVLNNTNFKMDSLIVKPLNGKNDIYYGLINPHNYSDYKTINDFEYQLDIYLTINNQQYSYESNPILELPFLQLKYGNYSISIDSVNFSQRTITYKINPD